VSDRKTPTAAALDRLTPPEHSPNLDLVAGALGPGVRVEQERISFAHLTATLAPPPSVLLVWRSA